MNKEDLRIIFLGNPEFAKFHLEKILEAGYNVVAVISAPDRQGGRGMKLLSTPVTQYAREKSIPCLQPRNLKNQEFQEELKSYKADLQIVIAFRMLPVRVWDMPPLGTYNLHASLLPQYRGAAPINWAIINGEKETGVSTFKLKHEIDTGNLIIQKKCRISSEETAGTLHDKLMYLGSEAVLETLHLIVTDNISEIPQRTDSDKLRNAPKLYTENTAVDWNQSGENIINLIRGLCPYPTAHTVFENKKLLIYSAHFRGTSKSSTPGSFFSDNKTYLVVQAHDGIIFLNDIKLQGKKRMNIKDFLNGFDTSHLPSLD